MDGTAAYRRTQQARWTSRTIVDRFTRQPASHTVVDIASATQRNMSATQYDVSATQLKCRESVTRQYGWQCSICERQDLRVQYMRGVAVGYSLLGVAPEVNDVRCNTQHAVQRPPRRVLQLTKHKQPELTAKPRIDSQTQN